MTTATTPRHHTRWMILKDLPAILAIDGGAWTKQQFLAALRERNCIGYVIEDRTGRVVGFALYELRRESLRVLKFAIHPDCRRQGYGWALMLRLAGKLDMHRRDELTANVPLTDLGALLFARSCGWKAVGVDGDVVELAWWM